MNPDDLLELTKELKSGDTRRLKSIFIKNSSYCIRILISKYKCAREDAEDIYIDSILNFREKIISGKIETLTDERAYLLTTCKNMFLVKLKKEQRINKAVMEINALNDPIHSDDGESNYKDEILKVTEEALLTLPINCQNLLKQFYFNKLSLEEIAKSMDLANANVAKVSKSRCFGKLVDQIKILQQQKNKYETVERGRSIID